MLIQDQSTEAEPVDMFNKCGSSSTETHKVEIKKTEFTKGERKP